MSALKGTSFALIFCLVFFPLKIFATDAGQYIPDSYPDNGSPKVPVKKNKGTPFLLDSVSDNELKNQKILSSDADSFAVPEGSPENKSKKREDNKQGMRDFGIQVSGSYDGRDGYLEHKNRDIIKEVSNQGKRLFSLTYIADNYDYKSSKNIFERTFNSRSRRTGFFFIGYDYNILKNPYLWLSIGGHGGFSYNSGKGIFSNSGTRSQDADIKLWTIPLDLSVAVLFSPFNFFDFVAAGGPSVMGAIQSRSDYQEGEAKKNRRQISPGYFYSGSVKINLSRFFQKSSINMYNAYRLSRFFLTLDARYHEYKAFQDRDFSVSGISYGGGFSFEFL